jgi:hypothetical protein
MHSDATREQTICSICGALCWHRLTAKALPRCMNCRRPGDPATRFWRYVQKTDTCWLWTSALNENGYGVFHNPGGERLAHRYSWLLTYGSLPDVNVLHNCPGGDNPACVNPSHLFLGNQAANMRDAAAKGRICKGDAHNWHRTPQRGESHPRAKLTGAIVRSIRERYTAGVATQVQMATEHGLGQGTVSQIVHRKRWRHVL